MKIFVLIALMSFLFVKTNGQNDALLQMKDSLPFVDDTSKVKLFVKIENVFSQNNTDSAFKYCRDAIILSDKIKIPKFQAYAYRGLGSLYKLTGELKKSEKVFYKSLEYAKSANDKYIIASIYNNLGIIYSDIGDYDKSLKYYIKGLNLFIELDELSDASISYNNIGLVFYYTQDYDQSLEYYRKSLKIKEDFNDSTGIALLLNNIGIIYYFKDSLDETFKYFKKSLKIYEKLGEKRNSANTLSNIGELYYNIGLYKSSINYYNEADKIYKDLKDTANIASTQKLIAELCIEGDYLDKSKPYLELAYKLAKKRNLNTLLVDIYNLYSKLYYKKKDYKKSHDYLEKYTSLKDSIFNIEKSKSIQELQTKYETKQKNQEIDILNKEKKISDEKIAKQRLVNFMLIGGIGLFIVIVLLVIRQSFERKRKNNLLKIKNAEITQQKEEIITQRDEIESQRNYVIKQRDLITEQKDEITDSINYAQKIQTAVLPSNKIFDELFKDYFIYYRPKDIVSGDFYWANKFGDYIVIAVADCTGHGVPGGFMSMLGVTYLTEIIRKAEVVKPNQVLNELRKYIINALNQKGDLNEQKDGMDFSICFINTITNELEFAGANNSIYIIDENEITTEKSDKIIKINDNDLFLYELKPDKMPIGYYPKMNDFTSIKVNLNKTSKIYMFTDGMPDQFGGKRNKKFTYKRFKNLLMSNYFNDLSNHNEILESNFINWKNDNQQIDDITVLGIKI